MSTKTDWDVIDGVVFDAVGTLIEPHPPVAEVYAEAAGRQGIGLSTDDVKRRFHTHFRHDERDELNGALVTDEATEERRWRRIVANVLPELPDPGRAFDELWQHFAQPDSWRCFPDVTPALEALASAGLIIGIASNFDGRLRRVAAELPALADRFDVLVISSEVGYRKPHPAFYETACTRLNMRPERVLCVGDDLENDVAGAIRAGLRAVWLDRHHHGGADVPSINDLTALSRRS